MIEYEHWKLIDSAEGNKSKWEILAYPEFRVLTPGQLDSSRIIAAQQDLRSALIKSATPCGFSPVYPVYPTQHVRITLHNSTVRLEPGAMHFMKGNIQMSVDTANGGIGGFFKRAVTAVASGEPIVKPKFSGSGELFLEPRKDHLLLMELDDFTLICDQGMFLACDESIQITAHVNSFAGAAQGGEGVVQPKLVGTGVALLASPVPMEKIMRIPLNNDTVTIDGPYAMVAFGDIQYTVEKATTGFFSAAASGEGYVNVFRGTGEVWVNLQEAKCVK